MTKENCLELKEIRLSKNLTMRDVYSKIPVTNNTLFNWETGRSLPQSERVFKKWCSVLGVEVRYKLVIKKDNE